MGHNSKIEWTHRRRADGSYVPGHTFNPWIGCSLVHEGCTNCYAMIDMDHRRHRVKWGLESQGGTRSKTSAAYWQQPLAWNAAAQTAGERQIVFCASLADLFEEWEGPILAGGKQPVILSRSWRASNGKDRATMDDLRRELFELIDQTPWLDWLLVTKRPENISMMWPCSMDTDGDGDCHFCARGGRHFRKNVWLLTSVSNQRTYEELWPHLAACRDLSPVLGISAEPLLGPLNIVRYLGLEDLSASPPFLDWVICGGESGRNARPMHPQWASDLRDQCQASGVPFFFKQWGEWAPRSQMSPDQREQFAKAEWGVIDHDGEFSRLTTPWNGHDDDGPGAEATVKRLGKMAAGRLLDGREWNEFPVVKLPTGDYLTRRRGGAEQREGRSEKRARDGKSLKR